jgi:hypothetical protein
LRLSTTKLCTAALGAAAILGCGFGDLFRAAGPRNISLSYQGDSVIAIGDSTPFSILISADGAPVAGAVLSLSSSDTTVVTLSAMGDTIRGVGIGSARVTARLESPMFTDTLPTLHVRIRVRGGGF